MIQFLIIFSLTLAGAPAKADPIRPDLTLTPGWITTLTRDQVCATKWGKDARAVTAAMKAHVYAAYGIEDTGRWIVNPKTHRRHWQSDHEVDHLISRELGGADNEANLWPEIYDGPFGAHAKDRLENELHKRVCNGSITLSFAQHAIQSDWIAAYRLYVPQK